MTRKAILPRKARGPGRPEGRFTQHRRIEGMRELLETHPGGVTIEDLANVMRVHPRSVRRYLSSLREQLDLEPVPTQPGGPNLWRVKPAERGRAVALRRTQAYLLLAARAAFEPLRGSALFDELDVAHRLLLQLAQRPVRSAQTGDIPSDARLEERLVVASPPATSSAPKGAEIDEFFRAVAELRTLACTSAGERLTCHPYALVVVDGGVACVARDVRRRRVRAIALADVSDAAAQEAHFELPPDFDVQRYLRGPLGLVVEEDGRRALIEFDAQAAASVRARKVHPAQRVAVSRDGRVRLSFPVGDLEALASWVLGFGEHARAVEPPDLVARVRERLGAALAKYR